ncbi:hypothetical protein [uncultured Enterovirga sp.]|uniref:hypothetical protein n=1 Tax=uncultured Enterovirga sp. TaxID=2026352 RepID=UPI0035CB53A3
MVDNFDFGAGQFRSVGGGQQPAMLIFQPTGANMTTYEGKTLVVELKPGTTREQLQALTRTLNGSAVKISVREI